MNYSPDNITKLEPNEVFVFGSNLAGIHGCGAAKFAVNNFGAKYGQGKGAAGQTYAIATKDENLNVLPIERIADQVRDFLAYAREHSELKFLVTQVGCGLAGFRPEQIAPLFFAHAIPKNVLLPKAFLDTLKE